MDGSWFLYYMVDSNDGIMVIDVSTESNNTISLGDNRMSEENKDWDGLSDFDLAMSMPDIEKHIGKFVAVVEHEIVAICDGLEEAYIEAVKKRKNCDSVIYITGIPTGHPMIYAGS